MAAVNKGCTWKRNIYGAKAPFKFPVLFGAGSTTAIKSGEILDLTTGTAVPLASDKAMSSIIAVSDCEIRSGDLAGYRLAVIPREGDIFEYALASAAAPAIGAALYFFDSETVTTSGSNQLGQAVDESIVPLQGFGSVNPSYDQGTTLRTVGQILFAFKQSASYLGALFA